MAAEAPAFDAARLIADVRKGDGEALKQAYGVTFGNDLGRLVLAHFLHECGVGGPIGVKTDDRELAYAAGRHDAALDLASQAGFDQATIGVAVMTDELRGTTDDPGFNWAPEPDDLADEA